MPKIQPSRKEGTTAADFARAAVEPDLFAGVIGAARIVMTLDATRAAARLLIEKIDTADFTERAKAEITRQVRETLIDHERLALQGLIDATPVTLLVDFLAEGEAKVVAAVLGGTTWLTAQQVGKWHNADASNKQAVASRWKKEGKIFSIDRAGQTLYPKYAFDEVGNPLPKVAEILKILSGYRPFSTASWFESTNSMLGGRRPRDVLATDPALVIEAAKSHVEGPVHG